MKNKLESILQQLTNNLPIILLLPAIFGGLWQLFELSSMSISFIRFFSPTQLLPDGLLILFIFFAFFIAYFVDSKKETKINLKRKIFLIKEKRPITFNTLAKNQSNKLAEIDNPIYSKGHILLNLIALFFGIFLVYWLIKEISHDDGTNKLEFIQIIFIFISFLIAGKFLINNLIILGVNFLESKFYQKKFSKMQKNISIEGFEPILFIIALAIVLYFASEFHKKYFLPENLLNLQNLQTVLQNKNYIENKISYFNDKYIFIEHKQNDKTISYEILRFDSLFEKK